MLATESRCVLGVNPTFFKLSNIFGFSRFICLKQTLCWDQNLLYELLYFFVLLNFCAIIIAGIGGSRPWTYCQGSGNDDPVTSFPKELNDKLILLFTAIEFSSFLLDTCRSLQFRSDHILQGKRLRHHVFRSGDVIDAEICEMLCFLDANCVSLNFKKSTSKCELNNSTFEGQKDKLESNLDYRYHGAKVRVLT